MIAWSGMKGGIQKIAGVVSRAPFVTRAFLASTRPRRFLILGYHRVNDDGHPFFRGTPVALFRRQMEELRRHFTVRPLAELAERARLRDLPRNGVAVTFDDGYRDNYENAFPILRELGLEATIFLTTDALDGNALLWHDRVFDAFHRTRRSEARFEGQLLPLGPEERKTSLAVVLARLRRSSPRDRDVRIASLLDELEIGPGLPGGWEKLTWQQVREMAAQGISFGAHTLDHPILTLVREDEARRQIRESKARIETELGTKVRAFAYPNGSVADFDSSTQRIVEEEGLALAVTTVAGANDGDTNPYALRRTGMWGDDPRLSTLRLGFTRL
jgi:peptidoglycan/xylan/chitin deacetylase (PgdA/CDA1 family)